MKNDELSKFESGEESAISLSATIDLNIIDKDGNNCLHIAIKNGWTEVVRALLARGADVNKPGNNGQAPLEIACQYLTFDDKRKTALREISKLLISKGAKTNIKTSNTGYPTFLFYAVGVHDTEMMQSLINQNKDLKVKEKVQVKDKDGQEKEEEQDVPYLKVTNDRGENILFFAVADVISQKKDLRLVLELLLNQEEIAQNINAQDRKGNTALHITAEYGDVDRVRLLVEKGADIRAENKKGDTPLHLAGSKAIAELLIEKGADIRAENKEGDTPLHLAMSKDIAELLIEKRADIRAENKEGNTPLHLARSEEIAEWLIEKGADIATKNNDGQTILHTAINQKYPNIFLIGFLIEKKELYINAVDKNGNTPLHLARSKEIAEWLIEKGADIATKNNDGQTILHTAINRNADSNLIKFLVEEKVLDVNAVDRNGKTPLDYALEKDSYYISDIIDLLKKNVGKPALIKNDSNIDNIDKGKLQTEEILQNACTKNDDNINKEKPGTSKILPNTQKNAQPEVKNNNGGKKDNDNNIDKTDDTRQNTQKNEQQKPKDNNGGKKDNDNIIDKTGDTQPNTQKNEQPEAKDKDGGKKDNSKRNFFIIAIGVILAAILGWMSYLKWDSIKNIFSSLAGKKSNISKGNSRLSPDSTYSPSRGSKISGRE